MHNPPFPCPVPPAPILPLDPRVQLLDSGIPLFAVVAFWGMALLGIGQGILGGRVGRFLERVGFAIILADAILLLVALTVVAVRIAFP